VNKELIEQLSWSDRMEYKLDMLSVPSFESTKHFILILGFVSVGILVNLKDFIRASNIMLTCVIAYLVLFLLELIITGILENRIESKYMKRFEVKKNAD
jgi:membrane protein CcdC involved in cytochrome C biogenesis